MSKHTFIELVEPLELEGTAHVLLSTVKSINH